MGEGTKTVARPAAASLKAKASKPSKITAVEQSIVEESKPKRNVKRPQGDIHRRSTAELVAIWEGRRDRAQERADKYQRKIDRVMTQSAHLVELAKLQGATEAELDKEAAALKAKLKAIKLAKKGETAPSEFTANLPQPEVEDEI